MLICIQQPSYLPWIGYFEQIARVDTFVFFDDVQFTKKTWKTRNRIKTPNGELWLSVPVITANAQYQLIKDVRIDYSQGFWVRKHLRSIRSAYQKALYFEEIYSFLENILNKKNVYLVDLNCDLIISIAKYLQISTNFIRSSTLNCSADRGEFKVIEICNKLGATYLYNGAKARDLLDVDYFEKAGIQIEFQNYKHPIYPQLYGEFIPYLSIIDLLFNCGPEAGEYIWGEKFIQYQQGLETR